MKRLSNIKSKNSNRKNTMCSFRPHEPLSGVHPPPNNNSGPGGFRQRGTINQVITRHKEDMNAPISHREDECPVYRVPERPARRVLQPEPGVHLCTAEMPCTGRIRKWIKVLAFENQASGQEDLLHHRSVSHVECRASYRTGQGNAETGRFGNRPASANAAGRGGNRG